MSKKKPDLTWVHRHAGLAIQFKYQDEGKPAQLDYTRILGQVPRTDIWIVQCDLTVTDGVAAGSYWWPSTAYLAVYGEEDGTPASREATAEELRQVMSDEEWKAYDRE